jgi:Chalcone isomerase-like
MHPTRSAAQLLEVRGGRGIAERVYAAPGGETLKRLIVAIVFAATGAWASAPAVEIEGVAFQPTVQVGGQTLQLNGAGLRTRAFFDIYAAGLYVPQKSSSPAALLAQQGPRRVAMTMLRDIDGETFSSAVAAGLKANNSAPQLAALAAQIETFQANLKAIGDARERDVIHFEFTPEAGTRILVNGQQKGSAIAGGEFFAAVLRAWLGDHPADPALKQDLLGL